MLTNSCHQNLYFRPAFFIECASNVHRMCIECASNVLRLNFELVMSISSE